ncbi:hypothetical protein DXG01_015844 [Tephrocybe rancida]|nr:hypothetical protein DXG01_015844 [Tephrocybe rancida]
MTPKTDGDSISLDAILDAHYKKIREAQNARYLEAQAVGPFVLEDCMFEFSVEKGWSGDSKISAVHLKAKHPAAVLFIESPHCAYVTSDEAATITLVRIRRDKLRGKFHSRMESSDDTLIHITSFLFDNYGRIAQGVFDGPALCGSGAWGDELNRGDLLVIHEFSVDERFRSLGLGSEMLRRMFASKYVQPPETILCWPSPVNAPRLTQAEHDAVKSRQIAFYRKNGFRRIGHTEFFGYSPDPTHPSHAIAAIDDANEKPAEELPHLSDEYLRALMCGGYTFF